MARLRSEDEECASCLEISPERRAAPAGDHKGQRWEAVTVRLSSGGRELRLDEAGREGEGAILCREPDDEPRKLARLLSSLRAGERQSVSFEPAEPSFEISFRRTREGGIEVHCWLDAGNASTGFYRWDAAGIRFYTTDAHLADFVSELEKDFPAPDHTSATAPA